MVRLTFALSVAAVLIAGGGTAPLRTRRPARPRPDRPAVRFRLRFRFPARHVGGTSERSIADTIELLVIVVRAGLTTRQAIEHLAATAPPPARPAFTEAVTRLDRGQPPADALEALPDVLGREARTVVDLIGPADRYGLPLAPALELLAAEARRSRRRQDEADARRLPVRLSFPLVVCTLPSFVLLAIAPTVLAAISSLRGSAW
jgi:pilus assembly protein TadC